MRSSLLLSALSLALCLSAGAARLSAATPPDEVSFRYRIGKVEVDPKLNPNGENLTKLENILSGENASSIQRIDLRASSSPDGPYSVNARYAHERAEALKKYVSERVPSLPESVWNVEEVPEDWDGIAAYLRHSTEDYKDEAMQIVRSGSANRKQLLQDLYTGEAWDDLYKYAFPWLRAVKLRIVYAEPGAPEQGAPTPQVAGGKIVSDGAFPLYYGRSSSVFNPDFSGNSGQIAAIRREIAAGADSLALVAYASPEGTEAVNNSISNRRSVAVRDYLSRQTGIPAGRISFRVVGEDWDGFYKSVVNSYQGSDREEVLRILTDASLSPLAKENALKRLDGGRTWQSLIKDQMPDLRRVEVTCLKAVQKPVEQPVEEVEEEVVEEEVEEEVIEEEVIEEEVHEEVVEPEVVTPKEKLEVNRPLFAVSTNLLYDAATAFNLGLEIPLGRQFSLYADGVYNNMPFPLVDNSLVQLMIGDLGVNYYFNTQGPAFKGWYATAGVGGGKYNLVGKKAGYDGVIMYLAVGGGYSFQLGKGNSPWRLKLAAGFGPMHTPYKYSERNAAGDLVHRGDYTFTWGLPTSLQADLVYVFQRRGTAKSSR